MSRLYGDNHRALQEQFDSLRLADAIEKVAMEMEVAGPHKDFIESRDMFFLSSVDHKGRPTVSYKGGDPGFVKVVDDTTVVFPSYDGNGMFLSMGNIRGNPNIGMLFISFEVPHRLRLQGEATLHDDDPAMDLYKEADLIVRVKVSEIFCQLSALCAQVSEGRSLQVRTPYRVRDAVGGVEAYRYDPGGVCRPGTRGEPRKRAGSLLRKSGRGESRRGMADL